MCICGPDSILRVPSKTREAASEQAKRQNMQKQCAYMPHMDRLRPQQVGRTEARGYFKKPAKKLILQESLHGFGFGATCCLVSKALVVHRYQGISSDSCVGLNTMTRILTQIISFTTSTRPYRLDVKTCHVRALGPSNACCITGCGPTC